MKATFLYYLFFAGLLLFTGCMVGKPYTQPETAPATIAYRDTAFSDTTALMTWFDLYKDTALRTMIKTTLDSNRNLLLAASRMDEAMLQTATIKANLYPQFGYRAEAGGGSAGTEAQKVGGGIDGGSLKAYGTLNWEIDLWGKIRHANNAAFAQYLAIAENRNALKVSLVAEVASDYFLLRDLDNRLLIAQQTLASRKEYTKIISRRFDTGYIPELDKLQAIQQEAEAAAIIPALNRQIAQTENAIRVLMGMGPGHVSRGATIFDQALTPDIPVGLPSQLLQRRPDIVAEEKTMQAQFEQIGVAQANRFPSISLTGLLGFASPELTTFISSKGLVANGFGSIAGPIFNFGQRKKQVAIEQKRFDQTYYHYQQAVLSAFGDVDNALTYYRTYSEEFEQRRIQKEAAAKALQLSQARYDFGYTSYLEVIIMQNNLFSAQFQESQTQQGKLNAIVLLYKSLGGGW
ncbi:MAG TPA: efflux transporter outer membrane subunit [Panacibacter sp.]|nr:efflux transporter outer membrane subunit [Panacibacter sp.]HNP46612.1 efflux transporter outer membrane subunit [Panacibacter sp.]